MQFLVDRNGQPVKRYKPSFDPLEMEGDVSARGGQAVCIGSVVCISGELCVSASEGIASGVQPAGD